MKILRRGCAYTSAQEDENGAKQSILRCKPRTGPSELVFERDSSLVGKKSTPPSSRLVVFQVLIYLDCRLRVNVF